MQHGLSSKLRFNGSKSWALFFIVLIIGAIDCFIRVFQCLAVLPMKYKFDPLLLIFRKD